MISLRTFTLVTGTLAACCGLVVYRAARSVPEFYETTTAIPEAEADKAGHEFTATTVSLAGQVRREGDWSALFTDAQVNGWLAVDLPQKHPELLPPGYEQPRVRFTDQGLQLGVRYHLAGVPTIVWIDVDIQMTGAQEAAFRFRRVRAGLLPLPLGQILDALTQVADDLDLPMRWTTVEGDPTAIVGLLSMGDDGMRYDLDALELTDGELYLSGRTTRLAKAPTVGAVR